MQNKWKEVIISNIINALIPNKSYLSATLYKIWRIKIRFIAKEVCRKLLSRGSESIGSCYRIV